MLKRVLFLALFLHCAIISLANPSEGRLIVHLLDYIANDYQNAVSNGKVISEFEYAEMLEFNSNVQLLCAEIVLNDHADKTEIFARSKQLDSLMMAKASSDEVAIIATKLKDLLIELADIKTAPNTWPSIANGQKLYVNNCSACHGESGKGDGIASVGLNPMPTNFTELEGMGSKSPLQAYHTIKFGVEGTAMTPFVNLADSELWDLAFFIHTLKFDNQQQIEQPKTAFSLAQLASKSDVELKELLQEGDDKNGVAWWRLNGGALKTNSLSLAKQNVSKAVELVKINKYKEARAFALSAYLDGIEPIELTLSSQSPQLVREIEIAMGALRALIEAQKDAASIELKGQEIYKLIDEANKVLAEKQSSFWLTFSLAATVILREGLEAFLVIIIILSVLRSAGAIKAIKWVHFGWLAALALGFAGWFLASWLLKITGAQREILEGVFAIIAVIILLYIGFWMHGKSEAKKWNDFVKNKINVLLKKESMLGLASLSFLVVFREAFESVLFLSAISLDDNNQYNSAIGLGVASAFIVVGLIAVLMLKYSKRIPITQLFKISSLVVAILSIVLIGKGFNAIQEAGLISISAAPFNLRISLLGIYPTLETIGAQLFILVLVVLVWFLQKRATLKLA